MKQKNIIIGAAIVGVAGYFGYRAIKKARDKKKAEAEAAAKAKAEAEKKASGTTGGGTTGGGTTYQGPSPYQQKVMSLQTRLGIGVDGDPGYTANSQTNKAVASWFPVTYARLGNVSPSNIDAYLALGTRRETAQTGTTTSIVNRSTQLKNALNSGQTAIIRNAGAVGLGMFYDQSSKSYKPTGGSFTINQNAAFKASDVVSWNLPGFWIVDLPISNTTTKKYIAINPSALDIYTR